jgi:hypothetical protein
MPFAIDKETVVRKIDNDDNRCPFFSNRVLLRLSWVGDWDRVGIFAFADGASAPACAMRDGAH